MLKNPLKMYIIDKKGGIKMAFLELNIYSQALCQNTQVNIILPEKNKKVGSGAPDGCYKTLWLLHGLSGNHTDWVRKTSIERYAAKYSLCVVMPNVSRSWYADTAYGAKYFTYVTKELPDICRSYFKGMSEKREDNIIAGLSMGGYGAIKAALLCPENYGYCASLSGSLDITRKGRECDLELWKSNFGFDLKSPDELENTEHDLYYLTRENKKELPKLYMWCGTEDFLIKANREYSKLLCELGIEHRFDQSEGDHTWKWWDKHIVTALEYLLGGE